MFLEDDDIFGGSPRTKFFDIVYNANRNLVENELENLLDRYVAMEIMLEEKNLGEKVDSFVFENPDKIEQAKSDVYINFVGDVLTNNE